MDGQSITLKIAGKDYSLKAQSPEAERFMRHAAKSINDSLARYDEKFPDKSLVDKLAFVALNETVGRMKVQLSGSRAESELEKLTAELGAYLDRTEGNR